MRRVHPLTGATARTAALLLAVWVVATASAAVAARPKVQTEVSGHFDTARLSTCRWSEGQPAANPKFEALIRRSVETQLRSKGVKLVEGEASCAVRTSVVRSPAFPVAVLVVEVLDSEEETVTWRGEASGLTEYPLTKLEKIIAKSIKKMFKEFPRVD